MFFHVGSSSLVFRFSSAIILSVMISTWEIGSRELSANSRILDYFHLCWSIVFVHSLLFWLIHFHEFSRNEWVSVFAGAIFTFLGNIWVGVSTSLNANAIEPPPTKEWIDENGIKTVESYRYNMDDQLIKTTRRSRVMKITKSVPRRVYERVPPLSCIFNVDANCSFWIAQRW